VLIVEQLERAGQHVNRRGNKLRRGVLDRRGHLRAHGRRQQVRGDAELQ
jgi:hypothetical protein